MNLFSKQLVIIVILFNGLLVFAQTSKPPANWHLNNNTDSISGINVNKAYSEFLNSKKPKKKIIVAVIDGGTDYNHEDLKNNIWVNANEKPNNGLDDDLNGYADDLNGWSFLGSEKGDQHFDQIEATRVVKKFKLEFEGKDENSISKDRKNDYKIYKAAYETWDNEVKSRKMGLENIQNNIKGLQEIKLKLNKDSILLIDVENFKPENTNTENGKKILLRNFKNGIFYSETLNRLKGAENNSKNALDYHLNTDYDGRAMINDNYQDVNQRNYGNNHSDGPDPKHGTAVAGCIAATRNNNKGIEGITNDVEIMIVRAVPDGDERDKDIANAIRYAVDKQASIINMSFGKAFSTNKSIVDEAIKYAESKDVLIVHAAGNDGKFIDKEIHFPSNFYGDTKKTIKNMITVGANDFKKNPTSFSNYGPKSVDVFAPGKDIYTTFPGSKYGYINGTSFSCPITAGVAALIRTYYPELKAAEVKDILIKSVEKVKTPVPQPGNTGKNVKYKSLCKSGGIIDAYSALKLAEKKASKK
jgi:subtilisin family serine protease